VLARFAKPWIGDKRDEIHLRVTPGAVVKHGTNIAEVYTGASLNVHWLSREMG
jgi:hypothetical protein